MKGKSRNLEGDDVTMLPEVLHPQLSIRLENLEQVIEVKYLDVDERDILRHLIQSQSELPRVFACSQYIAGSCIANPGLLFSLIQDGSLDKSISIKKLKQAVTEDVAQAENGEQLDVLLRKSRRKQMIRIGWRDLAGFSELEETLQQVSALADVSIACALEYHYQALCLRYGKPVNEQGQQVKMVVLGLGKLGGYELNYSSDVDLIFSYAESGQTLDQTLHNSSGNDSISNQEFFIKLSRRLIKSLDERTADGFVFRTDMRLRPNGESGPIVLSFAAMESYYETHGRNWERYALIKARVVAGDEQAGQDLLSTLRPFIYRKYLDYGAFDALREMKRLIESELSRSGLERNIKLGKGGIREVEFLTQSHQLIWGGREKSLQTQSLYYAMDSLVELGIIEPSNRNELLEGYRFLRNTEHRLQMVNDAQTQLLPDDDIGCSQLAYSMGFNGWPEYLQMLDQHRHRIHSLFSEILESGKPQDSEAPMEKLSDIWNENIAQTEAENVLTQTGYQRAADIFQLLTQFRQSKLYQSFSSTERDRADKLMPLAIHRAGTLSSPERAITAFISVIESIGRRSVYLSLLFENPMALQQLLRLCSASPWISRWIGRHPVVLDELLQPILDVKKIPIEQIRYECKRRLDQVDLDDDEWQMNVLREFHHGMVLRVAAADVVDMLEVEEVHLVLSQLAEVILEQVYFDATRSASQRLSDQMPDEASNESMGSGIIAYGKFASGELGYHSDLDVVVCFDSDEGNTSDGYFYSRVARKMVNLLTTRTQAGLLYELDMRLRPSGKSGTLVTSLAGFQEYQLKHAWTWEHQALVRARMIVGPMELRDKFEAVRRKILCQPRNAEELQKEIVDMRTRMYQSNSLSTKTQFDIKLGRGGLVDIEFLVQYLVLLNAATHEEITIPRNTVALIDSLEQHSLLDPAVADRLKAVYRTWLRTSLDLKLEDLDMLVDRSQYNEEREVVKLIWQQTFG